MAPRPAPHNGCPAPGPTLFVTTDKQTDTTVAFIYKIMKNLSIFFFVKETG